ncbi:unnamed protein product [Rhizophagus irregularis]|nr:unnamed protein product [Rhizophagus irregularis]
MTGTIHTVWVGSAEFFSFLGLLLSPFSLRLPLGLSSLKVKWNKSKESDVLNSQFSAYIYRADYKGYRMEG